VLVEKLHEGDRIMGTMIRICRNPIIANIAQNANLDFIMADMELGSYSLELLSDIFMATRSVGLGAFVRVPELSRGYVSRALDLGAHGVMVPMIESVEQARTFVEWSKYTPLGNRGMSAFGGHTDYRKETDVLGMMKRLNQQTLTIAQIETAKGVQCAEEIAAVEGIDVLLIGPNDLSVSLGCPGDLNAPQQLEAISKVAKACQKSNKIFGMHATASYLEKWIPEGLRFIMCSTDFDIMVSGMKSVSDSCRTIIKK
jgi:4-hydroxy-2-oxoheptanedioate aldolase